MDNLHQLLGPLTTYDMVILGILGLLVARGIWTGAVRQVTALLAPLPAQVRRVSVAVMVETGPILASLLVAGRLGAGLGAAQAVCLSRSPRRAASAQWGACCTNRRTIRRPRLPAGVVLGRRGVNLLHAAVANEDIGRARRGARLEAGAELVTLTG